MSLAASRFQTSNLQRDSIVWELPLPCAYHSHTAPAIRMAMIRDDREPTGESGFPMCRNHRESDIRDFIEWVPLPKASHP